MLNILSKSNSFLATIQENKSFINVSHYFDKRNKDVRHL